MSLESFDLTTFSDRFDIGADAVVTLLGPSEALALSTTSLVGVNATLDDPLLILSTGLATDVIGPNVAGAPGTDLGIEGGINDDIILTLELTKPESANNFRFDFTFLSNEFPDFQPDDFNDFFSVSVNGSTVPGGSISINSATFDPDLSTEGTQFNGRTDNLRATIPLDVEIEGLTLTLRIADEGDGRIDSAAIINNFAFTNNTVFIDFQESDLTFNTLLADDLTFTLPAADLTLGQQFEVLDIVAEIYEDFNVTFTLEQPEFPVFSTIHVGGLIDSVPDILTPNDVIFSRSEGIDTNNEDPSDNGFVLS